MPLYLLMNVDGTVEPVLTLKQPDGTYSPLDVEISKRTPAAQAHIASWKEITESDLPKELYVFREAWRHDGEKVRVDMPAAREMQRDRLRAMRVPKMDALDIEFTRALGADDVKAKKAVEAKRQALRDVTNDPAIEQANTPEALAAVLPEALR